MSRNGSLQGSQHLAKSVLVTGASGYLGSALVTQLSKRAPNVIAVQRTAKQTGKNVANIACHQADLADEETTKALLHTTKPSAIVHAAATISGATTKEAVEALMTNNTIATANLVRASLDIGLERFVFCSTGEVYGETPKNSISHHEDDHPFPRTAYGHSKLACETIVSTLHYVGTQVISARMPGIHGHPRAGGVIAHMVRAALKSEPILVSEPDSEISFIWRDDAADIIARLAEGAINTSHSTINIASGSMSLKELAATVQKTLGSESVIEPLQNKKRLRTLDTARLNDILGTSLPPFERGIVQLADALDHQAAANP